MGKISNNLITEKALRATRVNKAIENFIKAHGGSWVVGNSSSIPEHISYTAHVVPSEHSRNGYVGVSRKVLKYTPGKGTGTYTTSMFDKNASRYVANALNKATGHDREMSKRHFKETSTEPASNSAVKNSIGNKLKNSKAGNWLRNTKVGSYFTDSPLTPMNVALTHKPHMGGTKILRTIAGNPVAYAANAYGMGSGGGYMPVGEHTVDQLRIQHGQDEVSNIDTVVPMNPQGTMYLDPELGFQPTEVLEDYEGGRYYRNAQTGQFEPLDYNPRYSTYVPLPRVKKVYPTDSNGIPYLNDILGGVLSMPMSTTPLPIPPMHYDSDANKPLPPMSADEGEIPSGTVVVGPDTEVPAQPVQSTQPVNKPNVAPVVRQRRAPKPGVVNNTPAASVTPVSIPTPNVTAPTLSSVASQAVRHNGGFDNYRRESVLSALRAAGGISPAEAVQRGIIPWEALNYV